MLFTGERFPNLVVTKNGVIVATWGKKTSSAEEVLMGVLVGSLLYPLAKV